MTDLSLIEKAEDTFERVSCHIKDTKYSVEYSKLELQFHGMENSAQPQAQSRRERHASQSLPSAP